MAFPPELLLRLCHECTCGVCGKLFTDPTRTSCQHIICRPCITAHLRTSKTQSCPLAHCRATISRRELIPDDKMQRIVQILKQYQHVPGENGHGGALGEAAGEAGKTRTTPPPPPPTLPLDKREDGAGHRSAGKRTVRIQDKEEGKSQPPPSKRSRGGKEATTAAPPAPAAPPPAPPPASLPPLPSPSLSKRVPSHLPTSPTTLSPTQAAADTLTILKQPDQRAETLPPPPPPAPPIPPPSSSVASTWGQGLVVACSGLQEEHKALLTEMAQKSGCIFVDDWDPLVQGDTVEGQSITHIVCLTPEGGRCTKRTMKYLQAVTFGRYIVSLGWVQASLKAKRRMEETEFEIQGDLSGGMGGPQKARRARAAANQVHPLTKTLTSTASDDFPPRLLAPFAIYPSGAFLGPRTQETVPWLVQRLGGCLLTRPGRTRGRGGGDEQNVVVVLYDPAAGANNKKMAMRCASDTVVVKPLDWLLNAVGNFASPTLEEREGGGGEADKREGPGKEEKA